jgi:hypothetical protein
LRNVLLAAAACLIVVSLPVRANESVLKLSKPGGTWSEYLSDVVACNTIRPRPPGNEGAHRIDQTQLIARSTKYFACMSAKGYQVNQKGFVAAQYLRFGNTSVLVPKWN